MSKRIIQFTQLGNFGRFGNQMFQYAFARAYAEKYNAILETPNWIGEKIFNIENRPISKVLPRTELDIIPWGEVNIDLFGYFQKKECFDILVEKTLREWFTFKNIWMPYLQSSQEVVAHIRAGDYASTLFNIFCVLEKKQFVRACKQFNIVTDITWSSEENPLILNDLNHITYSQQTNSMYGKVCYPDMGISFLGDFFRMINSKILLRSNSSFSFWAGFFQNKEVYSPQINGLCGIIDVNFVKGNHSAICNVTDDIIFRS
jgi:hypothetical protein